MGIYDRDYMQESPQGGGADPIVKFFMLLLLGLLLMFALRFPLPLLFKVPLLVGLCFLIVKGITG